MQDFTQPMTVTDEPDGKAIFIRRTYAHLAGAILAFVVLTTFLVRSPIADLLLSVAGTRFGWLAILGGFVIFGRLASGLATSSADPTKQYVGLTLYVIAESVIFTPLLYIAAHYSDPMVLPAAGVITLFLFGGLTLVVFTTKKDFSFLRGILAMGGMVALGLIVCSVLFGFSLGIVFSGAMVLLACGAILYDTSRILKQFPYDQHVAASLQLFASVALLFWYVLRILMSMSRR
jgi:uncharacterized protein